MFFDFRNWFSRHTARAEPVAIWINQGDGLMRAILAGDVTEIAADTFVVINFGDALVIQVESFPFLKRRNSFAHKIHDAFETFGIEVIVQTFGHVFHDPEAVMHDGRADLDAG